MLGLLALTALRSASAQELEWGTEWKPARAEAARSMRPILLDFTASWCAPCRAMDQSFWPHPQVREQAERFVLVRVDFDTEAGLRQKFGVRSIPHVVVLDPWENRLGRLVGWSGDPRPHLALLHAVPQDFAAVAEDAAAAAAGKADGFGYERLGELYFPTQLAGASHGFFERAASSRELKGLPDRRALALAKVGWCELRLNDVRSARKSFEKALALAPERFDLAIAGLAIAWARLEKPDRATPLLDELRAEHAGSQMTTIAEEQVAAVSGAAANSPR